MEEYSSQPSAGSPAEKESSEKSTKSGKKDSVRTPLEKLFEKQNQTAAAEKIANSQTMWQRLTGEKPVPSKAEAGTEPAEKPAAAAEPAKESETVEIPLHNIRDEAEAYVDSRRDAVNEELAANRSESPAGSEAAADSLLLDNAREELKRAPDEQSLERTIDTAYDHAAETIHSAPAGQPVPDVELPATAPPARPAETVLPEQPEPPAGPYPPQAPFWVQEAYRRQQAAASNKPPELPPPAPTPKPEAVPTTGDVEVPWFYRSRLGRRFYPSSWPPKYESTLDKVSEETRARHRRTELEREAKAANHEQIETMQRYIDRKEQAIRHVASEQFASAAPAERTAAPAKSETAAAPAPEAPAAVPEALEFPLPPAELPPPAAPETARSAPPERSRLRGREALELSKEIIVGGTSVHDIYEAKRITEPGLHHIVTEYLRGGDVKKALEQEILIKELAYERDPRVRSSMTAAAAATASTVPLVPLAAAAVEHAQSSAPASSAAATVPAEPPSPPASRPAPPAEQTILRAWVAVMILLAVIAVVLLLR